MTSTTPISLRDAMPGPRQKANKFGELLCKYRKAKGFRFQVNLESALREDLGYHMARGLLSKYEAGLVTPPVEFFYALNTVLKLDLAHRVTLVEVFFEDRRKNFDWEYEDIAKQRGKGTTA